MCFICFNPHNSKGILLYKTSNQGFPCRSFYSFTVKLFQVIFYYNWHVRFPTYTLKTALSDQQGMRYLLRKN